MTAPFHASPQATGAFARLGNDAIWTNAGEAYVRTDHIVTMPEFIAGYGVDCGPLLDEAGISRHVLDDMNAYYSWKRHSRFCELAAQACNEPNFGLKHALFMPRTYPQAAPLMLLAQFSRNFREWIESASQYATIYSNGFRPHLHFDAAGNAVLRLQEPPHSKMSRHHAEGFMTSLFFLAQEITQRHDAFPNVVRFHHAEPQDVSLYPEVFKCPVEFSSPHNEIVFEASYLQLAIVDNVAMFRKLVDIHLKRKMRKIALQKASLARAVTQAIPLTIGTELCTARSVANSLGMSEKKMQRLLRDEGTSFRAIFMDVRKQIAHQMLVYSNVPLEAISGFLGYNSGAAFTLAFTNWFGQAPSVYRREKRVEPNPEDAIEPQGLDRDFAAQ